MPRSMQNSQAKDIDWVFEAQARQTAGLQGTGPYSNEPGRRQRSRARSNRMVVIGFIFQTLPCNHYQWVEVCQGGRDGTSPYPRVCTLHNQSI